MPRNSTQPQEQAAGGHRLGAWLAWLGRPLIAAAGGLRRFARWLWQWILWLREPMIEAIIVLCGWSAILFVFGIFFFVFREGAPFLVHELDLRGFFTTSEWAPTAATPRFGILGLLAGTLSVTALAMALAVPFGLGAAVYV